MKKIFVLIAFSFLLITSCNDSSQFIDEENNFQQAEKITSRSDIIIGGAVLQQNDCGPEDYLGAEIQCNQPDSETRLITLDNGCIVEATMDVAYCFDEFVTEDNYYIHFSNFEWHLSPPYSQECANWAMNNVRNFGFQKELIAPCANFFIPDCGSGSPWGSCIDDGCN